MYTCALCNVSICKNNNIYKGYDLTFCSPTCRNVYFKNNINNLNLKYNWFKNANKKSYSKDLNKISIKIIDNNIINNNNDINNNGNNNYNFINCTTIKNTFLYYIHNYINKCVNKYVNKCIFNINNYINL